MTTARRSAVRTVVGLMLIASAVAACTSTGAGVTGSRADQHGGPTTATDPAAPATGLPAPATDPAAPATVVPTPSTEPEVAGISGPSGVGDVLFPDLGNPGLDVDHYDIDLTYDHDTGLIEATVTLTITATEALKVFTLDAVGLDVSTVSVDGVATGFVIDDPELVITPPTPIASGDEFDVAVDYSTASDNATVAAGVTSGWFRTANGSFVLDEPDGARTWLPSNDHPSDKATYRFTLHLPPGVTGAANGVLISHTSSTAGEEWVWDQAALMTTYVIQLMTGPLDIVNGDGPGGLPLVSVLQHGDQPTMQPFLDATAAQLTFFAERFGPYPFATYGIAMTDGTIGGAMEEQGRSLFSRSDFSGGKLDSQTQLLLSHELTHQWFGDAVSPVTWQDIWLNESFATYGQWMWLEHVGFGTVVGYADDSLAQRQGRSGATGRPTLSGLFGYDVYEGGAVVLQALRDTVGDDHFFTILRTWVQSNLGTSRSSQDFIDLSSKISGQDLKPFFDDWLYSTDLPAAYPS